LAVSVLNGAAASISIVSTNFDFVKRVGWGTSTIGDTNWFSVYAIGNQNGAQQTFFRFTNALQTALASQLGTPGPGEYYWIHSASLCFSNGQYGYASDVAQLASTAVRATTGFTKTTFDGTSLYPDADGDGQSDYPGTTASFAGTNAYLRRIASFTDNSVVDVTTFVRACLQGTNETTLFLTSSRAATGTGEAVTNATLAGANFGAGRHWAVGTNVLLRLDAQIASAGPLAAYPFDDGTASDVSGAGRHGIPQGGAVVTNDAVRGSPVLALDGAGDYVRIADTGALRLTNGVCTVAAWIDPVARSNQMILFHGLGCSTWGSWFLSIGGSEVFENPGRVAFGVRNANSQSNSRVVAPAPVETNRWTHVCATHDGSKLRLFLDGDLAREVATTVRPFASAENLYLGGDPGCGGRSWFSGRIDDVRMWNRQLNPAEVFFLVTGQVDYRAHEPQPSDQFFVPTASPVLNWTFYNAPEEYRVYFGTNGVLSLVSTNIGQTGLMSYTPPGPLRPETEYSWRVDVVVGGVVTAGKVWRFTTPASLEDLGFDEIVFIKRKPYSSDHYYTVINNGTSSDRFLAENGIYAYNLHTHAVRTVVTAAGIPGSGKGIIGNLALSFDASKVLFDYRQDTGSGFRIWEVNLDGTGLRQVTFPPADEAEKVARYGRGWHTDDIDPCYLPDGGIMFSSTRCEHLILCSTDVLVAPTLHRMNPADTNSVEKLSDSPVSEFCPTVLPDGRVMYHRWEYIDKGARVGKTIWSMNPDGSRSEELFGLSDADHDTQTYMYPRPVPGCDNLVVCVVAPHYPQGNTLGPIMLIDLNKDSRTRVGLTNLTPSVQMNLPGKVQSEGWWFASDGYAVLHQDGVGGPLYTDPWPIDDQRFLVACKSVASDHYRDVPGAYGVYLIDPAGRQQLVYRDEDGTVSCWHPTPVLARAVPPVIPPYRIAALQTNNQALCIVQDVYEGMEGVAPGTIKYLRINEAVPKPWASNKAGWTYAAFSANWKAALWVRVQWGIVPVESDGSAHFVVPANRNIFFQALDENYQEIQRERTYVNYRPGEVRACVGCHERTGRAALSRGLITPLAMQRPPSVPVAQPCDAGEPRQVIHYERDVQPLFDARCVSCHSGASPAANLNLTNTLTTYYRTSYEQLATKQLAGPIIPEFTSFSWGDRANYAGAYLPPRSLGSTCSTLISTLRTTATTNVHYGLVTGDELQRLSRWVDSNYQFHGSYYGKHHSGWAADPDFRPVPTFDEAISLIAPPYHP
jgi:hypothetical protein